jgi:group I intron endonuclease
MPKCGIYKFTNKINGKIYIGQSIDINARKRSHINDAYCKGKDSNCPFHQAIIKYGEDGFNFEIIEECPKELLNEREKYWIQYYNSYHNGYNASPGGDNCGERSDGRALLLYDLEGNFVKETCNIASTARELGVGYQTVYQLLQGARKSTKGFQIKYKESEDFPKTIEPYNSRQGGSFVVLQLDKNDNILNEYKSVNEAARQTGCDCSTISKVCRGKLKTHGGFKWKYKEVENI